MTIGELSERLLNNASLEVFGPYTDSVTVIPRKVRPMSLYRDPFHVYVQFEYCSLLEFNEGYDDDELPAVIVNSGAVFLIKWSHRAFLCKILSLFKTDAGALIDNDHSLILPVTEFLDLWAINPDAYFT